MYLYLKNYIDKNSNTEVSITDEYKFIKKLYETTDFYVDSQKIQNSKSWCKLKGFISLKLLKDFIDDKLKSINSQYTTSDLNSFINGFPNEFDLLIVKKGHNISFRNIYDPIDIKTIVEVKSSGIIGTKEDIHKKLLKIKNDIETIKLKYNSINYLYITILEKGEPIRANSRNYMEETRQGLQPYKSFFVFDVAKEEVTPGELNRFINEIILDI